MCVNVFTVVRRAESRPNRRVSSLVAALAAVSLSLTLPKTCGKVVEFGQARQPLAADAGNAVRNFRVEMNMASTKLLRLLLLALAKRLP